MSQIRDTVVQYIQDLGEEAPQFFGKSKATINMWLKTGNIPLTAIEKVIEAIESPEPTPTPEPAVVTNAEQYVPNNLTAWQSEVERVLNELIRANSGLAGRVAFLEGNGPANVAQIAPPAAQRGAGQQVFEPSPRESNAASMVRPVGSNLATITTQPVVTAPSASNGRKPSDSWLKPRQPQK